MASTVRRSGYRSTPAFVVYLPAQRTGAVQACRRRRARVSRPIVWPVIAIEPQNKVLTCFHRPPTIVVGDADDNTESAAINNHGSGYAPLMRGYTVPKRALFGCRFKTLFF